MHGAADCWSSSPNTKFGCVQHFFNSGTVWAKSSRVKSSQVKGAVLLGDEMKTLPGTGAPSLRGHGFFLVVPYLT